MDAINSQLWRMAVWMVVTGVLGVFIWPNPIWVFLGLAGAVLFVVMLIAAIIGFSPAEYLARIIRKARQQ